MPPLTPRTTTFCLPLSSTGIKIADPPGARKLGAAPLSRDVVNLSAMRFSSAHYEYSLCFDPNKLLNLPCARGRTPHARKWHSFGLELDKSSIKTTQNRCNHLTIFLSSYKSHTHKTRRQ